MNPAPTQPLAIVDRAIAEGRRPGGTEMMSTDAIKQPSRDVWQRCTRCNEPLHPKRIVWLELNNRTSEYDRPGDVPEDQSQGLFAFGASCARRELGTDAKRPLDANEKHAIRLFARQQGRQWKAALRQMWESGSYWGSDTDQATLQRLRNARGPTWLFNLRPGEWIGAEDVEDGDA